MDNMMAEQARLEHRMATLGVDRFRKQTQEAHASDNSTRGNSMNTVLTVVIAPMVKAIEEFRKDASSGRGGRRHASVRYLKDLEPDALAFITAKMVLDGFAGDINMTALAIRIGGYVELEQRMRRFKASNPAYMAAVDRDLDTRTKNETHRVQVYLHILREKDDDGWVPWNRRAQLLCGVKLLELLIVASGLFCVETKIRGRRETKYIAPTDRFRTWLGTLDIQGELLSSPEWLPCVVPPRDWTSLTEGGYHTDAFAYPISLVKTRSRAHKKVLQKADLGLVYKAVNAIQKTPWVVNKRTLEVAEALISAGSSLAGLTPMDDEHLPSKPHDIDTNEEARKAWKRKAVEVYEKNRQLVSQRLLMLKTVSIAKEFQKYGNIYFPHQLDFRGRIYAVPNILNPQGGDLAKGLLSFSEGDPVGTGPSADWFLIHGANAFGVDKVSMEERTAWVRSNERRILDAADAPLDALWWTDADAPFTFLTWCFEYADYCRRPGEFRSRIPIAMDGSCNGLQHYSAMLRDPIGGRATNLTPSAVPQDIYGEVARVVIRTLQEIAATNSDGGTRDDGTAPPERHAADWLVFGIDRSITKRPVMVLPYGGTLSSCQKYVLEAALKKIAGGVQNPSGEELFKACNWLGTKVWEAIGEVVVAARQAMSWLRSVAGVVNKENLPLQWTTPSGFVVYQAYQQIKATQINTVLLGERFSPQLNEEIPDTIDRRRQVNGVAPNFVHSMDAAVLVLTVCAALAAGVTKFAMIHDSYGTTARHTPALAVTLREQFLHMYGGDKDILMDFGLEVAPGDLSQSIPDLPVMGDLDLSSVLQSKYFFA